MKAQARTKPASQFSQAGYILSPDQVDHLRSQGYEVNITWQPHPGMQTDVLNCNADEIGIFGSRYGGKSTVLRAFLVRGNPDLPDYDDNGQPLWTNMSYAYNPHYRALILRKNQQDLDDFIAKAEIMYKPFGGEFVDGQFRFHGPPERPDLAGAVIDVGHMKDAASWQRHLGIEYTRIGIEEAPLLPTLLQYDQLRGSCRSIHPELRAQVILTGNAGGPGHFWILDRFIEPKDKDGKVIPPNTLITDEFVNPFTGEKITQTRIFFFSQLTDNPAAMKDATYIAKLASITDEKLRRSWLLGDWTAYSGQYFGHVFRPKGPKDASEPPNANHVIPAGSVSLPHWWHRSISLDWGRTHEAAAYWGCQEPGNGRVHVYREFVAPGVSAVQLGYEIAIRSVDELKAYPSHAIVMHISPDAFDDRSGERSVAELIALGMERVLGPNAIHLPDLEVRRLRDAYMQNTERTPESDKAAFHAMEEIKAQRKAGITFRMAMNDRVAGWQYCLEAMRFLPIGDTMTAEFDPDLAAKIMQQSGITKWLEYIRLFQNKRVEVLPKLQIWGPSSPNTNDGCPRLIDAFQRAQHSDKVPEDVDKTHFKGMDSIDSARYLLCGMREEDPPEPFESVWERRHAEILSANPDLDFNSKVRIYQNVKREYEENKGGTPFTPLRGSRARRRLALASGRQQNLLH